MLSGNKVILKEIDPENLEQLRKWRNDPKVRKYFRAYKDITKDMQHEWYKSIGNNSDLNHVYFQIVDNSNNKLAGVCGLHYVNWHIRSAEVSIFVAVGEGKGLGTEALTLICKYGFEEMNMHKIWAEIFDNNPASLHLFHKVGFVDEGILRDNHFSEGKYGNSYRLSMLKKEWASNEKDSSD